MGELVGRGDIGFAQKALAASEAGAVGVIIVNNDETEPDALLQLNADSMTVGIPVVMVSFNEGKRLKDLDPITLVEFKFEGQCHVRKF